VLDPSNKPVNGAQVVLIDLENGERETLVTGVFGRYLFRSLLAPGRSIGLRDDRDCGHYDRSEFELGHGRQTSDLGA